MNTRMILAVSIALGLAAPAFAQDYSQPAAPAPTTPTAQTDQQAAAADSQSMNADATTQPVSKKTTHHRTRHHPVAQHNNANMALTGNEPRIVAYQMSNQVKSYPAVDPGHVPGDPPVIDHHADQAATTPTTTTVTVPPTTIH